MTRRLVPRRLSREIVLTGYTPYQKFGVLSDVAIANVRIGVFEYQFSSGNRYWSFVLYCLHICASRGQFGSPIVGLPSLRRGSGRCHELAHSQECDCVDWMNSVELGFATKPWCVIARRRVISSLSSAVNCAISDSVSAR